MVKEDSAIEGIRAVIIKIWVRIASIHYGRDGLSGRVAVLYTNHMSGNRKSE